MTAIILGWLAYGIVGLGIAYWTAVLAPEEGFWAWVADSRFRFFAWWQVCAMVAYSAVTFPLMMLAGWR